LGDAVVEFLASIHLYHMFPDLEEGGLATYRAAIVQNQHLAQLAKNLQLDQFMLYAHGSDLCHDLELRHAVCKSRSGIYLLNIFVEIEDTWCLLFFFSSSLPFSGFYFLTSAY
jgi:ribonuclease-3